MKIVDVPDTDFLASTLWPNNPSVHPPILYGLFKDWDYKSGQTYLLGSKEAPEMIYADVNEVSADYIDKLNKEHVAIVERLREVFPDNDHLKEEGFDYLKSLIFAYGDAVEDRSSIFNALRSMKPYKKHKMPYVVVEEKDIQDNKRQKTENGEKKNGSESESKTSKQVYVKPNVDHKFYTTDLPYGLCTFKDMAKMLDIETPVMDEIIYWNQKLINKTYLVDNEFTGIDVSEAILPSKFGLTKDTLDRGNRA